MKVDEAMAWKQPREWTCIRHRTYAFINFLYIYIYIFPARTCVYVCIYSTYSKEIRLPLAMASSRLFLDRLYSLLIWLWRGDGDLPEDGYKKKRERVFCRLSLDRPILSHCIVLLCLDRNPPGWS